MPMIFKADGTPIHLGTLIGKGGEGSVHEVVGDAKTVAKLYHAELNDSKAQKLEAMVQLQTDRLRNLTAWPTATLYSRRGGRATGLLMRRIAGYKEVHHLYSPKSRKSE